MKIFDFWDEKKDPYEEGVEAFFSGNDEDSCPYGESDKGTAEMWIAGFSYVKISSQLPPSGVN